MLLSAVECTDLQDRHHVRLRCHRRDLCGAQRAKGCCSGLCTGLRRSVTGCVAIQSCRGGRPPAVFDEALELMTTYGPIMAADFSRAREHGRQCRRHAGREAVSKREVAMLVLRASWAALAGIVRGGCAELCAGRGCARGRGRGRTCSRRTVRWSMKPTAEPQRSFSMAVPGTAARLALTEGSKTICQAGAVLDDVEGRDGRVDERR